MFSPGPLHLIGFIRDNIEIKAPLQLIWINMWTIFWTVKMPGEVAQVYGAKELLWAEAVRCRFARDRSGRVMVLCGARLDIR